MLFCFPFWLLSGAVSPFNLSPKGQKAQHLLKEKRTGVSTVYLGGGQVLTLVSFEVFVLSKY